MSPEKFSVFLLSDFVGISEMFLEIFYTDIAHPTLHHLHHRQWIWLQTPSQFSNSVQVFLPIDTMNILEVGVDRVPIVLDHLAADLALERLRLCLTPSILLLVVPVCDVMLVLDVTVESSVVVEDLGTQSTREQARRSPSEGNLLIGSLVSFLQLLRFLIPVSQF